MVINKVRKVFHLVQFVIVVHPCSSLPEGCFSCALLFVPAATPLNILSSPGTACLLATRLLQGQDRLEAASTQE